MPKSKQVSHEYYCNYETCRNRMFDTYAPSHLQIEDVHLSWKQALEEDEDDDE